MKLLPLCLLACGACVAPPANPEIPGELPQAPPASAEHEWLQQLVGTWKVSGEADMGPDQEPMLMEYHEKATAFGEYWVSSELNANFGGTPFSGRLTIGYDPQQGAFVGTWVDTFNTYLWTYHGWLDEDRRVLTLESEGPSMTDPSVTTLFRDVVEVLDRDHKRNSSWVLNPDGEWVMFMTSHSTRVR